MSKRKLIGLVAVAALVIAGAVAVQTRRPAPAGAVAVSCVLTVPTQVGVNAPFMSLSATKTCTGANPLEVTWVGWTGTTKVQDLWFLNAGAIELPIYDDDPMGVRTWKGEAPIDDPAASPRADEIVFNQPVTDIRMASTSPLFEVIPASGAGPKTIRGQATRFAYTLDKFVPWASAGGQVQYKEYPSGVDGPWRALRTITTDASGNFSFTYTAPGWRLYRIYYPSVTYIFGHGTAGLIA